MNTTPTAAKTAVSPVAISAVRLFYWSVRREFWENRSLYLAPLGAGALIVMATAINVLQMAQQLHTGPLDPAQHHPVVEEPFIFASMLLMASTAIVSIFYSVDALYGERRDRSVLFWKSLPVSDMITVLAKLSIPILVLPLLTFAITFVVQWIMLLLGMLRAGTGYWGQLDLLRMWWAEFFHLVAFHGIWWAPFWGWFLLASAWSRRAPLLWATLPPLAIGFGEKIAFGTTHFAHWLNFRFAGSMDAPPQTYPMSTGMLMPEEPFRLFLNIHLWTGFAMCALFIALAVRLRRWRGPV